MKIKNGAGNKLKKITSEIGNEIIFPKCFYSQNII